MALDTSVMEYTAEDLIAHTLLRAGILVAKPKFDRDGADFWILERQRQRQVLPNPVQRSFVAAITNGKRECPEGICERWPRSLPVRRDR